MRVRSEMGQQGKDMSEDLELWVFIMVKEENANLFHGFFDV